MNLSLIAGEQDAMFSFWGIAVVVIVITCLIEARRGIFLGHLVSKYPQLQRVFQAGWSSDLDRSDTGCPQSAPCGFAMILWGLMWTTPEKANFIDKRRKGL